jgi:DNA polymerase-3 subunit delta
VTAPAHLVKGEDPILRADALDAVVRDVLGDDDRTLALEEIAIPGRGSAEGESTGGGEAREAAVASIVNAAQSPPFMTAHRVVVVRDVGNLTAGDLAPLLAYLDDPLDTTVLVFVSGGGRTPDALAKKLKAVKAPEHGPAATATADVLDAELDAAGVTLKADAVRAVTEHLGQDAGRVGGLVDTLAGAFGAGARLGADDVAPYLGEAGSVPVYQLTNAIEGGDVAGALEVLHRLLHATGPQQPKPMHPLQITAMLHGQYRRLARLDDPGVRSVDDAMAALGGRVKQYPARKALDQARALGTSGIREAFDALFQADLDIKGARAIPADVVVEVLVARLATLSARSRPGGARSGRPAGNRSGSGRRGGAGSRRR